MSINEAVCGKKSRGRPKQFDRDRALESALDLFWRHGYEATSLADLVEVTGAKAPTLYAEFGNKEGCSARRWNAICKIHHLHQPAVGTGCAGGRDRRGLRALFRRSVYRPRYAVRLFYGVRLRGTVVRFRRRRPDAAQKHHAQEAALKVCFDRKVQQGELLAKTDTALLAKYVICTIEGMSVQAREGASRSDLLRLLEALMLVWPRLSQIGNKV